jgi:hypothetical protein
MNAITQNLSRAATPDSINMAATEAPIVRIIAVPVPWPSLKEQPNRASLRMRWRCFTEEGVLLVSDTTHPLADGAAALLLNGQAPPSAKVTLRHSGKAYDSFGPMRLEAAAAQGIRRIFSRGRLERLAAKRVVTEPQTDNTH